MKKFLLTIVAAVAMIGAANAQGLMVGGTISYEHDGPTRYDGDIIAFARGTSNLTISPSVFYFVNENLAVGGFVGVSFDRERNYDAAGKIIDNATVKGMLFGIEPAVRYYLLNDEKFGIYGQASLPVAFGSRSDDAKTVDENIFSWGFQVCPGVSYNITDNLTVDLTLGGIFDFTKINVTDDTMPNAKATSNHSTNFNVNLFNGVSLSLYYKL